MSLNYLLFWIQVKIAFYLNKNIINVYILFWMRHLKYISQKFEANFAWWLSFLLSFFLFNSYMKSQKKWVSVMSMSNELLISIFSEVSELWVLFLKWLLIFSEFKSDHWVDLVSFESEYTAKTEGSKMCRFISRFFVSYSDTTEPTVFAELY